MATRKICQHKAPIYVVVFLFHVISLRAFSSKFCIAIASPCFAAVMHDRIDARRAKKWTMGPEPPTDTHPSQVCLDRRKLISLVASLANNRRVRH